MIESEKIILGSIILNNERFYDVYPRLTKEMFGSTQHQRLFSEIKKLSDENVRFDIISLSDRFDQSYLSACADMVRIAINYELDHHVEIVIESYKKSSLVSFMGECIKNLSKGQTSQQQIDQLGLFLSSFDIDQEKGLRNIASSIPEFLDDMQVRYERKGGIVGLTTGLIDLDKSLMGLGDGELVIIAGRPSMGKTAFMQNIAISNIRKQKRVVLFSLEMTELQLQQRLLANMANIDYSEVQTSRFFDDPASMDRMTNFINDIKTMNYIVDDSGFKSIGELRSNTISYQRKHGKIDMIMVDYLQLLTAKSENRLQEISKISRELKRLAKDMDCPIVALSQLSRNLESRNNKRPIMSDLRESGQIEQDADKIIFIYRDEVYYPDTPSKGLAELIVAKARNSEKKDVVSFFDGAKQAFRDADKNAYAMVHLSKQGDNDEPNFIEKYGNR